MIEMSSGLGATAMGIGVSHGTGGEGVAGGCRLRAQNQGQASGSTMQHNPQSSQQQQQQQQQSQQQQQQQAPSSQQQSQQQQRQTAGFTGRSKKDNCCLCWCCCCSCSWNKCLAAVGGNSTGSGGAGDQGKKKGNAGVSGDHGSGISVTDFAGAGAGNGLDGLDGLDGGLERCSLEEVRAWGSSFDKLMRSGAGRKLFREFLVSEYSEENIAFWLACEQLKRENNPETIEEKARYIYEDYISILSPKEVSLDSRVREIVNRNMVEPTPHTFDEAQLQIYTLMHRDSYPRFVNSEIYRRVARMNSSGPPSPSTGQEHSGKTKSKRGAT
ncbi:regulator of G-protein signaling 19 isoform X2 [Mycetomoellerius zeteki]|uniref:regulator of G-protein signaling 19 isoform X2 n=1 Tax=Mycetomoellerius zeteki TaxID=64791 RepID=UPI00084E8815|nr:PREDICTED: regulator of G-protein signaling 19 isoform X2 [Trachymyrmex zeteki]